MNINLRWYYIVLAVPLALGAVMVFVLNLHHRPHYMRNFESAEYSRDDLFIAPDSIVNGLAVYSVGTGEPVLLLPYPHSHTAEPMAQSPLAEQLVGMGRQVITFDVPGAYRSTREPIGDMDEIIDSADEALDRLGIDHPVDVVGHSMSGFTALAYAIERPEGVDQLVLVGAMSGFPAAARYGLPGSAFTVRDPEYWQIIVWGMRLNAGRANLATHKRLQNLMAETSYYDKSLFEPVEIEPDDVRQGVPVRTLWSRNMYSRLSYADRLGEVQAPTLIIVGEHDPEAPPACSRELADGISDSQLLIVSSSGHYPFVEEAERFIESVDTFLNGP